MTTPPRRPRGLQRAGGTGLGGRVEKVGARAGGTHLDSKIIDRPTPRF